MVAAAGEPPADPVVAVVVVGVVVRAPFRHWAGEAAGMLGLGSLVTALSLGVGAAIALCAGIARWVMGDGPVSIVAHALVLGALALPGAEILGACAASLARGLRGDRRVDALATAAEAVGLAILAESRQGFAATGAHSGRPLRIVYRATWMAGVPWRYGVSATASCAARGWATFRSRGGAISGEGDGSEADTAWIAAVLDHPEVVFQLGRLLEPGGSVTLTADDLHAIGTLAWLDDARSVCARLDALVELADLLERGPRPPERDGTSAERKAKLARAGFEPPTGAGLLGWAALALGAAIGIEWLLVVCIVAGLAAMG